MDIKSILKRKEDHIPISGYKTARRISDKSMNWHSVERNGRMVACDCMRCIRIQGERHWCESLLFSRKWKYRLYRSKWNIRDLNDKIKRVHR